MSKTSEAVNEIIEEVFELFGEDSAEEFRNDERGCAYRNESGDIYWINPQLIANLMDRAYEAGRKAEVEA